METITYEELMEVNGGRRTRGPGSGGHAKRRSWWSRHKKTVKSHARAAGRGFSWARGAVFAGRLIYALFNN